MRRCHSPEPKCQQEPRSAGHDPRRPRAQSPPSLRPCRRRPGPPSAAVAAQSTRPSQTGVRRRPPIAPTQHALRHGRNARPRPPSYTTPATPLPASGRPCLLWPASCASIDRCPRWTPSCLTPPPKGGGGGSRRKCRATSDKRRDDKAPAGGQNDRHDRHGACRLGPLPPPASQIGPVRRPLYRSECVEHGRATDRGRT